MSDSPTEAAERAARAIERSRRLTRTVDEPSTPEERIELLVELTRAAWAASGKPWPNLPRSEWPIRVLQLEDER